MSILLLSPLLLPFIVLIIIPLLMHLFARTKPPVYNFSSNRFLEKIIKHTKRLRKPQDILLLILRTLLFTLIIFMFLNPILFQNNKLAGLNKHRNVVIMVDASESMGYLENGQTRFSNACAEASNVLRTLSGNDTANVIFIKTEAKAIFPENGSNKVFLRDILKKAKVSNEPGNVSGALKKAVKLLSNSEGNINEIIIISDFQKTQWSNQLNLKIPKDIAVTLIKTGNTATNTAISRIYTTPLLPFSGDKIQFHCEVSNFSSSPIRIPVYFHLGEIHESKNLSVPPFTSATSTFSIEQNSKSNSLIMKPGIYPYEFSIPEDKLAEDNSRAGLVKIRENVKIAFTGNQTYPYKRWNKALLIFPWINCIKVQLENLTPGDGYDFLFISGWNGKNIKKIRQILQTGTTVVCNLSANTNINLINTLSGNKSKIANKECIYENAASDKKFTLKIANMQDDIFKIFKNGEYGDPVQSQTLRRLDIKKSYLSANKPIISYTDETIALAKIPTKNNNSLYIWNIPLNPKYSNFANKVQFVPLMAEFILSRNNIKDVEHLAEYIPGNYLTRKLHFIDSLKDLNLLAPDNKKIPLKIKSTINKKKMSNGEMLELITSKPVTTTGLYTWKLKKEILGYNTVNPAIEESDLRTIDKSQLKKHGMTGEAGTGMPDKIHKGIPLWQWILALILICLAIESLIMFNSEKEVKI